VRANQTKSDRGWKRKASFRPVVAGSVESLPPRVGRQKQASKQSGVSSNRPKSKAKKSQANDWNKVGLVNMRSFADSGVRTPVDQNHRPKQATPSLGKQQERMGLMEGVETKLTAALWDESVRNLSVGRIDQKERNL
jgi:hypothetical protein